MSKRYIGKPLWTAEDIREYIEKDNEFIKAEIKRIKEILKNPNLSESVRKSYMNTLRIRIRQFEEVNKKKEVIKLGRPRKDKK